MVATIFRLLRFSVISFPYEMGLKNSKNSAKLARNRGRNDLPHFTIFHYFFAVLNCQGRIPISTNSSKRAKNRPLLYYFFLTSLSLRRTADVKLNALV